jgi:serine/threonine protein kinase
MYELVANAEIDNKYILRKEIGTGGFGTVWTAQHKLLAHKTVAIKFGLNLTGDAKDRFDNEVKILDQLRDNPYIIKVEDAGNYGPYPYIVLEFATAGDLDHYISHHPPTLNAIAGWLEQLSQALNYAHSKGIVHRDLKPANILFMQDGTLRLCDFGIAHDASHNFTVSGYSMGTVEYMAPEQITSFKDVGAQADTWALAVITLKLITGHTLFDAKQAGSSLVAAYQAVNKAIVPVLTVDRTGTAIPMRIQQVLASALEKDPQKRLQYYPYITKFANDFKLALAQPGDIGTTTVALPHPVKAKPPPMNMKRPPTPPKPKRAKSSAWVVPVIILGLVGLYLYFAVIPKMGLKFDLGSGSQTATPLTVTASQLWTISTNNLGDMRSVAWSPNGKTLAIASLNGVQLGANNGQGLTPLGGPINVFSVAWSPDGKLLAGGAQDQIEMWSPDGQVWTVLPSQVGIVSVAWSPDNKILTAGYTDGTIKFWTVNGQDVATLTGHTDIVYGVAWSPDGKVLASASRDHTVRLWSANGSPLATLTGHTNDVASVAWSPDSKTLLTASADSTMRLWSASGQALTTLTGHYGAVYCAVWSPDGKLFASSSEDGTVKIWSSDGKTLATLVGHTSLVFSVAWSPDGKTLASSSRDGTIKFWQISR